MTDKKPENTHASSQSRASEPKKEEATKEPVEKAKTKETAEKQPAEGLERSREDKKVSIDQKEEKKETKPKDSKGGFQKNKGKKGGRPNRKRGKREEDKDGFDEEVIDIARVTRVMAGGKRMSFRASIIVGDRKGKVGYGMGKSKEVQGAIKKAARQARKNIIEIPLDKDNGTIPHQVKVKFKAAKLIIIPAAIGTGIIAGGIVRTVLELGGVKNILSKNLGTTNKMSVAKATLKALSSLKTR